MGFFRRNRAKYAIVMAVAVMGVAFFALPALAQLTSSDLGFQYATELGLTTTDIRTTISRIVNAFLGLLGIILVVLLLYAGFLWMTSQGDAEKVDRAKKIIVSAIVGLVIILSAYAIASFILRAAGVNDIGGSACVGEGCDTGGGFVTGNPSSDFVITGISPKGPGPRDAGWPKNTGLNIYFNRPLAEDTVNASTVTVNRCNERLDGDDNPTEFDMSTCVTATGIVVAQDPGAYLATVSSDDDPAYFTGDFWYHIEVSDEIIDETGEDLFCASGPLDMEDYLAALLSNSVPSLCERAVAIGDYVDLDGPGVRVNYPQDRYYCEDVDISASAWDDTLVRNIDFTIEDVERGSGPDVVGLVDRLLHTPISTDNNEAEDKPFVSETLMVDIEALEGPGSYILRADAFDIVMPPNASDTYERRFRIPEVHCCNDIQDEDETGLNCGGADCPSCDGEPCSEHGDCASGYCDPITGLCAMRPEIESFSPGRAGSGSLVTIKGTNFGRLPGTVVFLGQDMDGDGDAADDPDAPPENNDDRVAAACSEGAWVEAIAPSTLDQVTVVVPADAQSGPIQLVTSYGAADRSDDDFSTLGVPGDFQVGGPMRPGICTLDPWYGTYGIPLTVQGQGFGSTINPVVGEPFSSAHMDGTSLTVSSWEDTRVGTNVPTTLAEGRYPVYLEIEQEDGTFTQTFNRPEFTLRRDDSEEGPRIIEITPSSGSVDTYVTIRGSGFGRNPGRVDFVADIGGDTAVGGTPICADNWHEDYIVVKVPETHVGDYSVTVTTATAPVLTSNDVPFEVDTSPLRPGLCSLSRDNGPPTTEFTVTGEGFGIGPAGPTNEVHFYRSGVIDPAVPDWRDSITTMVATSFVSWEPRAVTASVPGILSDLESWPATGPVGVVAGNVASSNTIPFTVHDCNETLACSEGTICCGNGVCSETCEREARRSAYGWMFSTEVLPDFPRVVRNYNCLPSDGVLRSPSPYMDSTDACKNGEILVEFTREMDPATFMPGSTIKLEECGSGEEADCSTPVDVPVIITYPMGAEPSSVVTFHPISAYPFEGDDMGTGFFREGFWYRATLVSDPVESGLGLRDMGAEFLDGDNDRIPGGNFSWRFRIDSSRGTCDITGAIVLPRKKTIREQSPAETANFQARPTAYCRTLQCSDEDGSYSISWDETPPSTPDRLLLRDVGDFCAHQAEGLLETDTDEGHTLLDAMIRRSDNLDTEIDESLIPVVGNSKVKVKFADPQIVAVEPTDGCIEACINSNPRAFFNVTMDATTFDTDTVQIFRCRDAACNEPLYTDLGSEAVYAGVEYLPEEQAVVLQIDNNFDPDTFYTVRIYGGLDGVISSSGVELLPSTLTDEGYYKWKFKTKNDDTACTVDRAQITPSRSTLYYVGETRPLRVYGFGPPDSCSAGGQRVDAWEYDWDWSIDPNNVLEPGFLNAFGMGLPVDSSSVLASGCTSDCRLVGADPGGSQCGNGIVEAGEDCDWGALIPADRAGCTDDCRITGATEGEGCGDGVERLDDEGDPTFENCDRVSGVFPPGCKDPEVSVDGRPELDGLGCILLGSPTGNSICGDGFVSDGESCDDSNRASGDGCSSICLNEGTDPICDPGNPDLRPCVSVCGDGVVQPGEDSDCELGGLGPESCDPVTCLKKGSDPSESCNPANPGCCNGVRESSEECDDGNLIAGDGCSPRCLFEGSNAVVGDFCGDGEIGDSEHPQCEDDGGADGLTDPYQVVKASRYDASVSAENSSIVWAETGVMIEENLGRSTVTLNCSCDEDSECSGPVYPGGPDFPPGLGCADTGCCIARPRAIFAPSGASVCRNAEIMIDFDSPMDTASVIANLTVAFDNFDYAGRAPRLCPEGSTAYPISIASAGDFERPGFLRRAWAAVTGFLRGLIFGPASASSPVDFVTAASNDNFCTAPGSIRFVEEEDGTVAYFAPQRAYPPDAFIYIDITGAESEDGVAVGSPRSHSFETRDEICAIASVDVTPDSHLFMSAQDRDNPEQPAIQRFVATGKSADLTPIVPVLEYTWTWEWLPQAEGPGATDPWSVINQALYVDDSDTVRPDQLDVWVRAAKATDAFLSDMPHDGEAIVRATAVTNDLLTGEEDRVSGDAEVTVMLCNNPWPDWQTCEETGLTLPWEQIPDQPPVTRACPDGAERWYPFTDNRTSIKFYYCRDGSPAGDSDATLPYLRDGTEGGGDIVRLENPAPGIFREYLFTYDVARSPDTEGWQGDAVGLRIMGNMEHLGVQDWYASQGFRGGPAAIEVGGYDALQEGRTVYTNAAARVQNGADAGGLYTNVYALSFNDDAAPETVAIFNQVLNRIDFNDNLNDTNICIAGETGIELIDSQGVPLSCTSDGGCAYAVEVRRDSVGYEATVPCVEDGSCAVENMVCDSPRSKLQRDVKRWADLQSARKALLGRTSYPTLGEGTFLRGKSYSAWGSWSSVLAAELGVSLASDPLNYFVLCDGDGYDSDTCWNANARRFMCPRGSHVYGYEFVGGRPELWADFEYVDATSGQMSWRGSTCIDSGFYDMSGAFVHECPAECTGGGDGRSLCNYGTGAKLMTAGLNGVTPMCSGGEVGASSACGDGVLGGGEECELGDFRRGICVLDTDTGPRTGVINQICTSTCDGWIDDPDSTCVVGWCGDGIVNGTENCDDGPLNGTYGYCNSSCAGPYFRCGDNRAYPGEACDCGPLNGNYHMDAVVAPRNTAGSTPDFLCGAYVGGSGFGSCSWDCSGPAPYCGDGTVDVGEECDGGIQQSRGACMKSTDSSALRPSGGACAVTEDCAEDETCVFCPLSEQSFRRACVSNDMTSASDEDTACRWPAWSCTAPGVCGNGNVDSGEECDDGNDNNRDACTNFCRNNVCGDGYTYEGVERCDDGVRNNVPCIPEYGRSCNYCGSSCTTRTVSGGFCGDGIVQDGEFVPPGPEACDSYGASSGPEWVCISDRPEDRSFGTITGYAFCSMSTCLTSCLDAQSYACLVGEGEEDTNTDSGESCGAWLGAISGDSIEFDTDPRAIGEYDGATWYEVVGSNDGGVTYFWQYCPEADIVTGFDAERHSYVGVSGAWLCPLTVSYDGCPNGERCPLVPPASLIGSASVGDGPSTEMSALIHCLERQNWLHTSEDPAPETYLPDPCDPDDDNDGVPDDEDCGSLDPLIRPEYTIPGTGITIPAAPERCNLLDDNCNREVNESSEFHTKVDMVFAFDISGSMSQEIHAVKDGIRYFLEYVRSLSPGSTTIPHRFGFVSYGNSSSSMPLDTWQDTTHCQGLTDIDDFLLQLDDQTVAGASYEPGYDAVVGLMTDPAGPYMAGGDCQIIFDDDEAQPYVVVVSDEPALGHENFSPGSMTESSVISVVENCRIGKCKTSGGDVEFFSIVQDMYKDQWDLRTSVAPPSSEEQAEMDRRHISIYGGTCDALSCSSARCPDDSCNPDTCDDQEGCDPASCDNRTWNCGASDQACMTEWFACSLPDTLFADICLVSF